MRYAILADIHSNLPALEAVLQHINEAGADQFLCLGDVVGYGASPNRCCDIIRSLDPVIVKGNHDHAAVVPGGERYFNPAATTCVLWTREQLTEENAAFLGDLDRFVDIGAAHLCHGALFDADYYTTDPAGAAASFDVMSLAVCLFGHSHQAGAFIETDPGQLPEARRMVGGGALDIDPEKRYMINPGSVGQPRDGNPRASCAIWDTEKQALHIHRIEYDIEAAQDAILHQDLPAAMAERLAIGV